MIRVVIVDDQQMIRVGLRAILEAQPGFQVVADAGDGLAALGILRELEADVVLMDLRMPGIDGVETTRRIRLGRPDLKIIVLTTFDQDENVLAALSAGANGFLSKGVGPAELAAGIQEVAAGGGALSAAAAAILIGHVADRPAPVVDAALAETFAALTARELEIVRAVAAGRTNA